MEWCDRYSYQHTHLYDITDYWHEFCSNFCFSTFINISYFCTIIQDFSGEMFIPIVEWNTKLLQKGVAWTVAAVDMKTYEQ